MKGSAARVKATKNRAEARFLVHPKVKGWRPEPESNRRARICSPLHNHSAIRPPDRQNLVRHAGREGATIRMRRCGSRGFFRRLGNARRCGNANAAPMRWCEFCELCDGMILGLCGDAAALAPEEGFEPPTSRLTAGCSTAELLRNTALRAAVSPASCRVAPARWRSIRDGRSGVKRLFSSFRRVLEPVGGLFCLSAVGGGAI